MLGSHIVHELSKRKHEISIFVLPNRKINFVDIPINRFEGNILDLESLKSALKGHDAIIHAAALTDIWPYRSKIVRDVNLQGTKNVAEASKSLGLKRVLIIVAHLLSDSVQKINQVMKPPLLYLINTVLTT